jgi:D-lactate dehydrogenase (cytochrome)
VLDAWSSLITECGGSLDMTWFAQSKKEQKELADIRHDLPDMVNDYIKRKRLTKVGTDIAVRHERLDDMLKFYKGLLSDAGFDYVMFGHIGDSHLHVNILPKDANQHQKAKAIYDKFVKKAVSLGGTVSAEHGIGKLKHRYLEMMYGKKAIAEMVSLKKSLDPSCILGLDNIFPKELLK